MNFQRLLTVLLAAATAILVSACSTFGPRSVTVTLSEAQLMAMLAEQFPVQRRVFDLFDLTLDAPRLRLLPAENRLATRVDFTLGIPSLDRNLKGAMGLNYGLRYEHADHTIRLADVKLVSFDVPGLPANYVPQLRQFAGRLVGELLNDRVVRKVPDRHIAYMQKTGLRPGQPRVTQDGLELALNKKE